MASTAEACGSGQTVAVKHTSHATVKSNATLIVAAVSIGGQWDQEIANKCPGLRVHMYHESSRAGPVIGCRNGTLEATIWALQRPADRHQCGGDDQLPTSRALKRPGCRLPCTIPSANMILVISSPGRGSVTLFVWPRSTTWW